MDKTVRVRLLALVDSYVKDMRVAEMATERTATRLEQLGSHSRGISRTGDALTAGVSVPLAAAGVAVVKLGNDFDTTFLRMQGLAGVTADEVGGLKRQVLSLAGDVGKGPNELANALYFASSAGYDSATAMDIVNKSAHAAAAGMGDTATIVSAVTSVMGTYGPGVIDAAKATDILTATVKVAKVEASQIAPELGRILPTAKLAKIGFADVGAALAFLTQSSGDASLSATQLDGVMRKLTVPSQQGKKALADVGLGVEDLHKALASGGLSGALDLVKEKFGGNSQALFRLFDDIQAYQGAALLTTDTSGHLADAFDQVRNSVGQTSDAFDKTNGPARDQAKAWAELQVALVQADQTLGPAVGDIAKMLAGALHLFADLPRPIQDVVLGMGALAIAVGPVMSIGGRLIGVWGKSVDIAGNLALKGADLGTAFSTVAATEAEAATASTALAGGLTEVEAGSAGAAAGIRGVGAAATGTLGTVSILGGALAELWLINRFSGGDVDKGIKAYNDSLGGTKDAADEVGLALAKDNGALGENTKKVIENRLSRHDLLSKMKEQGVSLDDITAAVKRYQAATTESDKLAAFAGITQGLQGLDSVDAAGILGNVADAISAGVPPADALAGSVDGLGGSMSGAASGADGLTGSLGTQKTALDAIKASLDLYQQGLADAFSADTVASSVDKRAQSLDDIAQGIDDRRQKVADLKRQIANAGGRGDSIAKQISEQQQNIVDAQGESNWTTRDRKIADANKRIAELRTEQHKVTSEAQADTAKLQGDLASAEADLSLTLDGNTDAARRNREALRGVAQDAADVITKNRDAGASLTTLQQIRALEIINLQDQLTQLGFNTEEIQHYIDEINLIPLTRETTITANAGPALTAIQSVIDLLTQFAPPSAGGPGRDTLGQFEQRAHGGPVRQGQPYVVGERGPEIFVPEGAGRITANAEALRPITGGGGYGTNVDNSRRQSLSLTVQNPAPELPSRSMHKLRVLALEMAS